MNERSPPPLSLSQGWTAASLVCCFAAGMVKSTAGVALAAFCVGREAQRRWRRGLEGLPLSAALLVVRLACCAFGAVWHDRNSRRLHCVEGGGAGEGESESESGMICGEGWMYKNVQREVWDTGYPFSYYKLKNVPHFLLASCTVYFVVTNMYCWLKVLKGRVEGKVSKLWSWKGLKLAADEVSEEERAKTEVEVEVKVVAEDPFEGIHEDEMTDAEFWTMMDRESFNSPTLAVHVAVAALLTLVVVIMAHVNIVTRVVPSHCMWFYWSLAGRMVARVDGKSELGLTAGLGDPSNYTRAVCSYLVIFNVLGAVMYGNYLPWV